METTGVDAAVPGWRAGGGFDVVPTAGARISQGASCTGARLSKEATMLIYLKADAC